MKKKKLYLETSVINFVYADDAPEKKEITKKMFELFKKEKNNYILYISDLVTEEIEKAPEVKAKKLLKVIEENDIFVLERNKESQILGDKYITEGLIPRKYEDDAYHIAIATVSDMDAIISWNFKHIVKMKTIEGVIWINESKGYKPIRIYSPWEVIGND